MTLRCYRNIFKGYVPILKYYNIIKISVKILFQQVTCYNLFVIEFKYNAFLYLQKVIQDKPKL